MAQAKKAAKKSAFKRKAKPGFKSNLPKGPDGKPLPPARTRKGTPNKISRQAKEAIALAFEGIGGLPALIKWAKENKTNRMIFYTQIYTKLIPVTVQGAIEANVTHNDAQSAAVLERILTGLIAERQSRGEEANIIIDATADREPVPQLVLPSKSGSEAA